MRSLPRLAAGGAQAQADYPDNPVRVILPFGPGGIADIPRVLSRKNCQKLGQNFVIENNPGAGGIAAAHAVLQAPPDGYTLAFLSNGTAISVPLFEKLPFDPLKQFVRYRRWAISTLISQSRRTPTSSRSAMYLKLRATSRAR